jgi:leucyl aminopeptidase
MDVTDRDLEKVSSFKTPIVYEPPSTPSQSDIIKPLLDRVSISSIESWLTTLTTSFKTRYYQSSSGAEAADWIHKQVIKLAEEIPSKSNISLTVKPFKHSWGQPSIIARYETVHVDDDFNQKNESLPIVVLSAHLDSVNQV